MAVKCHKKGLPLNKIETGKSFKKVVSLERSRYTFIKTLLICGFQIS